MVDDRDSNAPSTRMSKNNKNDTTPVANGEPKEEESIPKQRGASSTQGSSSNGVTSVDVPEELHLTKEEEEQLIIEAGFFKQRGNDLFRDGKYDAAREQYQKALDVCPFSQKGDRAIFHANIGACYFKQSKWKESADACSAALKDDPEYVKAFISTSAGKRKARYLDCARVFIERLQRAKLSTASREYEDRHRQRDKDVTETDRRCAGKRKGRDDWETQGPWEYCPGQIWAQYGQFQDGSRSKYWRILDEL